MRETPIALLLACVLAFAGCKSTDSASSDGTEIAPPPVSKLAQLRKVFEQNPNVAAVGVVQAVLPEGKLVQVAEVDVKSFKEGDVLSFVSADGGVTAGHVIAIKTDGLHVSYSDKPGQRAPSKGDLAVKFKN